MFEYKLARSTKSDICNCANHAHWQGPYIQELWCLGLSQTLTDGIGTLCDAAGSHVHQDTQANKNLHLLRCEL